MAGLGTLATTAIITEGLGCQPACQGLITAPLSLYCNLVVVPPVDLGSGGGGYPRAAWNKVPNIQDFYTPTEEQYHEIPLDKEADYFRKNLVVTLKIKLGDIDIEKTYTVPEKRQSTTIRVMNLLNATQSRISLSVKNVKRVINNIQIKISGLRVLKHKDGK